MKILRIETPYGEKLSLPTLTPQEVDGKAVSLHFETLAVDGAVPAEPRTDYIIRVAVNQDYAVQVAERVNEAETGLKCDADGHPIIQGYRWVGTEG